MVLLDSLRGLVELSAFSVCFCANNPDCWSWSFDTRCAAAMGATFALTEAVVANQRQKDDALNGVAGGCAAGFLAGIRGSSIHSIFYVRSRLNYFYFYLKKSSISPNGRGIMCSPWRCCRYL
jgi:hypothetical protein